MGRICEASSSAHLLHAVPKRLSLRLVASFRGKFELERDDGAKDSAGVVEMEKFAGNDGGGYGYGYGYSIGTGRTTQ